MSKFFSSIIHKMNPSEKKKKLEDAQAVKAEPGIN